MSIAKEVTLKELLLSRDRRAERQRELINRFGVALISFTINMPGKFKDTPVSRTLHGEGMHVLRKALSEKGAIVLDQEIYKPITGPEAYISVNMDELELKKILVEIEDQHPVGRLFDFDVIDTSYHIVKRSEVGQPSRKCLICEQDAVICVRSQRHSYDELIEKINITVKEYFNQKFNKQSLFVYSLNDI
ncbi:citrate lyase holo-[acyl-carrier protein] synthase [Petroclostridium sp. X23]|jgi:holo-ACP synthase|uniref:citrate lyase holo-[acyl-carrier protein] synthase n=1 Tax=Petroclostridium sp. X23 TaxID=3045146 RepID=UPI0024ACB7E3|nr:citrate lyase holo-[acyl-carrier protein] synthase [Petroclostridium sp. X23]WHH60852.1 citrate lyase holo-[acyl-carrier protein] synthase [Petroclostridium sp. X23]